jgi:tripartite-type tricarboxylate transporter receptor subunit TctC
MPVNTTSRIPDRSSRPDWVKVILHPSSLILGCALASAAGAPPWPAKPLRIVAPSAAGSAADTLARVVAPPLSERLGQPVVVDTRPGAATIIGTEIVAKSPADGHTLLIGLPALTINPAIYKSLSYDGLRDFTAITQGIRQPNLLVVHPSLPVRSTKELIALAKARPGELVYASAGIGAASHLTMELFMLQSGTKMLHVPYKGPTPGVIDLIAGRVSVMATSTTSTLTHVRSGRLRARHNDRNPRAPPAGHPHRCRNRPPRLRSGIVVRVHGPDGHAEGSDSAAAQGDRGDPEPAGGQGAFRARRRGGGGRLAGGVQRLRTVGSAQVGEGGEGSWNQA